MAEQADYKFGEFLVERSQNQISVEGDVRALEPRTMDVLVYLIQHRDRVVSADELLKNLWPGRVVEESTIHRRISQLRNALGDSSTQSRFVKTVVKRGYQAIAEVSIPEVSKSTQPIVAAVSSSNQRPLMIRSAAAVALFLLIGLVYFLSPDAPELFDDNLNSEPSIAVLPFTNMSEFPENEYFAAGVHEDLLTSLSGIPGLGVISRTSVLRYAEHEQSMQEIGEELNVNYVVEGSVRRQNQQVRITVQLIDALNDRHVWAMTYDRDLSDTFAVQSEITREVAAQLSLEILDKEVGIYEPEIHDVLFKARELMRERTTESLAMALNDLRSARSRDPENAEIHGAIGETLYLQSRANKNWGDVREEAMQSFELALELDPDLASARLALARVQVWWLRDIPAADENYQEVIRAEPNNAEALMKYGEFLANTRAMRDVGMPHLRRAAVLNPYSGEALSLLASNLMRAGNFNESNQVLQQGLAQMPEDYYLSRYQTEYFMFSGDWVQAMKHQLKLIKRDPESIAGIALLVGNLRQLEFYTEAQLWLDEMFRINPRHVGTYNNEVSLLRHQNDWQGLAQVNARWEPILGDYVTAPRRNWRLWSMQAEADQLWRDKKFEEAKQIYREISNFLIDARIPERMRLTVLVMGPELLELGNMLAHALIRADRQVEAEQLLIKITRNNGTTGAFEINKAQAFAMLGKSKETIDAFEKAVNSVSMSGELNIRQFMDQNTDWLNGINRNPVVVELYRSFLARKTKMKNRVLAEIPEVFDSMAFLASARVEK